MYYKACGVCSYHSESLSIRIQKHSNGSQSWLLIIVFYRAFKNYALLLVLNWDSEGDSELKKRKPFSGNSQVWF